MNSLIENRDPTFYALIKPYTFQQAAIFSKRKKKKTATLFL
jgi:hypothetical protein